MESLQVITTNMIVGVFEAISGFSKGDIDGYDGREYDAACGVSTGDHDTYEVSLVLRVIRTQSRRLQPNISRNLNFSKLKPSNCTFSHK